MDHCPKPVNTFHAPSHTDWFRHRQSACTGPTREDLKTLIDNAKAKALFTITMMWQQPRCRSPDGWLEKIWYIHTVENCSATKKETLPFATTWMDLETIMLSEISQRKTKLYHLMWALKNNINTNESIYKTEADSQTYDTNLRLLKGKGREEGPNSE